MVTQNPNFTITTITSTMYRSNNLHDNRLRSRNTSASSHDKFYCSMPLSISITMPAEVFKRNDLCFNKVGGFQDKGTSKSSQQDANMIYTKEAGSRITLLNIGLSLVQTALALSTYRLLSF
jgi:hypothetical protein